MRIRRNWMAAVLGTVIGAVLVPSAQAQGVSPAYPGPYSLTYARRSVAPGFVPGPFVINLAVNTSVAVPDGGTALVGGYSTASAGSREFGPPGLGKVPYASRPFRNSAYGRSLTSSNVSASVRVISLYDEEYRQTGVRSR
jgi:hypothetical protein